MPSVFSILGFVFAVAVFFQRIDQQWMTTLYPYVDASEWILLILKLIVLGITLYKLAQVANDPSPQIDDALADGSERTWLDKYYAWRRALRVQVLNVVRKIFVRKN